MQITKAAVIGGGAMGGAIAHVLSSAGIECFIKDVEQRYVDKALATSRAVYDKLIAKGKLDLKKAEACQLLLRGSVTYDREFFSEVDLVIEAVPEVMKLKQAVFAELEKICPEKAILATNTSTLSLTEIAGNLKKRGRFIGLHFFNPVIAMKLLEIIYDENTSDQTLNAMMELALVIDKVPIQVKNGPGFAVNRVLIPYMNEAVLSLMDAEAGMDEIDEAMVAFGMPMGPFALWDLVGLDVGLHASKTLEDAFGKRTPTPELLTAIVKKGMFGQKTGKGFYDYSKKVRAPSREVDAFLKQWQKKNGVSGLDFSPERLLSVQIREALLVVSEGLASAHDCDTGMVYGTNFPTKVSWGLLHFAEEKLGWAMVKDILNALAAEYGPDRFSAPAILSSLVDGESIFANCTYEVDEYGVAVMSVENPPMNVLSIKTINDITNTVLAACADSRVRVILLTGKGKAFVAGANIGEIKSLRGIHDVEDFAHKGHLLMNTIDGAPKPIICVINGFCLGGGLELAMACHMRIASDKARLGLPEINLGIIPGFGGTQRLPRIVGKGKALEMILTGNHITPSEALAIGLVNKVVPQSRLMDEAHGLARIIAAKSRLSVSAAIDAASSGLEVTLDEAIDIEVEDFARVTVSKDGKEGVDAFQNKRKPVFKDM